MVETTCAQPDSLARQKWKCGARLHKKKKKPQICSPTQKGFREQDETVDHLFWDDGNKGDSTDNE